MNMVIPNEGKLKLLDWMLVNAGGGLPTMTLALFENDYTPDDATTFSDFTEATFTGYSAVAITRAHFGTPAIVADVAYSIYDSVPTFTCTGGSPTDCYGWYLFTDDDTTIIAAQRFDIPRLMEGGTAELIDPFQIGLQTLH